MDNVSSRLFTLHRPFRTPESTNDVAGGVLRQMGNLAASRPPSGDQCHIVQLEITNEQHEGGR